jgi:multimeric flavodoxin WrbA
MWGNGLILCCMIPDRTRIIETRIPHPDGEIVLSVDSEDYSAVYPGMIRFILSVVSSGEIRAQLITNTYEYSPGVGINAEQIAFEWFDVWKRELTEDPAAFFQSCKKPPARTVLPKIADIVLIEGSPRSDGNCSILAEWAVNAAHARSKTVEVIYPHELMIHPCIGCYQCYNTGTCTFEDDMNGVIDAIRTCDLLIVCSPVYTNTVPGMLKVLIDRCQAYHAERMLFGGPTGQRGLLFAVAGRKGKENFTCVQHVVNPFMRNIGIRPSGECLVDGSDALRDICPLKNIRDNVEAIVNNALNSADGDKA